MDNPLLTAAFVIAATQFFKTQFGIAGKWALLCAFVVCLLIGVAPTVAALIPAAGQLITTFVQILVLFIGATGSYDFIMAVKARPQEITVPPDNRKDPGTRVPQVDYRTK